MNKKEKTLLSVLPTTAFAIVLSVGLLTIPSSVQEASAAITLDEHPLKIVITFTDSTGTYTQQQITNYLINTVWPQLEPIINAKMDANFDPGWSVQPSLRVYNLDGADRWQAYPKFLISGTTDLNPQQLRKGVSDLLSDLKLPLRNAFEAQGATDITFHVHYEDNRAPAGDES